MSSRSMYLLLQMAEFTSFSFLHSTDSLCRPYTALTGYAHHIALSSHPLVGRSLDWFCLLAIVSSISVNNRLATVFFFHILISNP